jgi:integrase
MKTKVHRRKGEKTWTITLDLGPDRDGKSTRQRIRGFSTKQDAKAELRRRLQRQESPSLPTPRTTLREFFSEYWFPHLVNTAAIRPTTLRNYRQLAADHILPVLGHLPVEEVRSIHCQQVLDAMTPTRSPHTVAHARACMSAAFRFAGQMELVDRNPARSTTAPQKPPQLRRPPNAQELRRIIDAAQQTRWEIPVLLSATTGARRSEILGLRWGAVSLEQRRIRIVESLQRINGEFVFTKPKSARSTRRIPVPPSVAQALRNHREVQQRRLLAHNVTVTNQTLVCDRGDGSPIDPSTYGHAVARLARSVGLTGLRLHDLRHGVATLLAQQGNRAELTSKLLGHSSVAFTLQTYVHPRDDELDSLSITIAKALALEPQPLRAASVK